MPGRGGGRVRCEVHREHRHTPENGERACGNERHIHVNPQRLRRRVRVTTSLDVAGPYCIVVTGTGRKIIEPTGSIVDPDTVTDVMPPRGEGRRHGEGPVITLGLQ